MAKDAGFAVPLSMDVGNLDEDYPDYGFMVETFDAEDSDAVRSFLRTTDWAFTDDDTSFLAHGIHPYPAKFIPQIPGVLISAMTSPGDLVLDPFGGSGTTALEAVRLGRRVISIDANPIATLIGRVKTCQIDADAATSLHEIRAAVVSTLSDLPPAAPLLREYDVFVPDIPNIEKWFDRQAVAELAYLRGKVMSLESSLARDISLLSLSRVVLPASFQESETRYTSKPRSVVPGDVLRRFLNALSQVVSDIEMTAPSVRFGLADFRTADIRSYRVPAAERESVDLVVTSPPYGNAYDYHLYHRFRLFWIGEDPRSLAKLEIGSHLRHQKESTGFEHYVMEMKDALRVIEDCLRPGGIAIVVVGDSIYQGKTYETAEALSTAAASIGLSTIDIVKRNVHETKRSVTSAGRRSDYAEKLLALRKPHRKVSAELYPPPYTMWPYEGRLRAQEIFSLTGVMAEAETSQPITVEVDPTKSRDLRRLVFTHGVCIDSIRHVRTWQAVVENGEARTSSTRKDPKYVTHGLHPYKGKFYPQLAKALLNIGGVPVGATVVDPFCGSGTTMLEAYLNGYRAIGIDMNPLAAKIARAKLGILSVSPDLLVDVSDTLERRLHRAQVDSSVYPDVFKRDLRDEMLRWFPRPVVAKLGLVIGAIRSTSHGKLRDFLEVVLSSVIREVSQQEPSDLRIRRRAEPISDADVFQRFINALSVQVDRILKFHSVRGHSPNRFEDWVACHGDSRDWSALEDAGVLSGGADLVVTSPPYATALPYIDTDRLSLLVLFGMTSSDRRPIENSLIGSREISKTTRDHLIHQVADGSEPLPGAIAEYLLDLHGRIAETNAGFRRQNMPALLARFFVDMRKVLQNCHVALKDGGKIFLVIGDNRMKVNGSYETIPTTRFVEVVANDVGLQTFDKIDITVTTENLVHLKNSIKENVVLCLAKS